MDSALEESQEPDLTPAHPRPETLTPLSQDASGHLTETALARRTRQTVRDRTCPRCDSNDVVLHGKDQNNRQRFMCRGCERTYNIMTGTPMARARKHDKWEQYLGYMTNHMPLRTIVQTGIGISRVTAWRWRHRFLEAPANDNAAVLSGTVQVDKTFLARSFKGSRDWKRGSPPDNRAPRRRGCGKAEVAVLTALDSGGAVFDAVLDPPRRIEPELEGRIAPGSVLCSARGAAYAAVARKANARHHVVANPATGLTSRGLGRVIAHHQGLRHLVNERCRGVATKYLRNYLGWHRAMTRHGFDGKVLLDRALA